jgi:hypothetical protein
LACNQHAILQQISASHRHCQTLLAWWAHVGSATMKHKASRPSPLWLPSKLSKVNYRQHAIDTPADQLLPDYWVSCSCCWAANPCLLGSQGGLKHADTAEYKVFYYCKQRCLARTPAGCSHHPQCTTLGGECCQLSGCQRAHAASIRADAAELVALCKLHATFTTAGPPSLAGLAG